jgi:hypothetical protein
MLQTAIITSSLCLIEMNSWPSSYSDESNDHYMSLTDDPVGISSYNNTIFLEMSIMDITVFSNIPSTAINKVKNDVNNINKTWALLQTTEGKGEPNIVLNLVNCSWRNITENCNVHNAHFKKYCVSNTYCLVFFFFLRLVYPMLPVSLDGPFLIVPSVFSNVYVYRTTISTKNTVQSETYHDKSL